MSASCTRVPLAAGAPALGRGTAHERRARHGPSSLQQQLCLLLAVAFLALSVPPAAAQQAAAAAAAAPCPLGNSTEAGALLQFRAGLANGAEALPDWSLSASADWSGVVCEGQAVAALQLAVRGLRGGVDWAALDALSALRTLQLSSNALTGSLSAALPPALTALLLADNQFTGGLMPAAYAAAAPRLETIDLSQNSLSGALDPSWAFPPALTSLKLAGNAFTGPLPETWGQSLPASLVYLSVLKNFLSGRLPDWPALPGLAVLASPQAGGEGFCGQVPTAPQYLTANNGTLHRMDPAQLPACPLRVQSPAPVPAPVPASPLPPPAAAPLPSPRPPSSPTGSGSGTGIGSGGGSGVGEGVLPSSPMLRPGNGTGESPPPPTSVDVSNRTEWEALMRFKAALTRSDLLDDWTIGGQGPCLDNWRGVNCAPARSSPEGPDLQVARLDLKALELAGPINWDALAVLSMMQLLDLSSNGGLTGTLGAPLAQSLQRVALDATNISGPVPSSWALPQALQSLTAARTQLAGSLPPRLELPPGMARLDLSGNRLEGALPATWHPGGASGVPVDNATGALPLGMEEIRLDSNSLSGPLPSWPSLRNMRVYVDPQRNGAGFCGTVPSAPRYLNAASDSVLGPSSLPPCGASPSPSPSPPPPPPEPGGSSNAGVIAGAAVGGAVAAAALVGGLVWWRRRRRIQQGLPVAMPPNKNSGSTLPTDGEAPDWQLDTKLNGSGGSGDTAVGMKCSGGSSVVAPDTPSAEVTEGSGGSLPGTGAGALSSSALSSPAGSGPVDIRPWQLSYSELDIIKPIGEGSSARVYVARWHQTIVAVKVFQTRGQQGQEVLKEGGGGGANGAGGEGGAPAQGLTLSSPLLDSLRKEAGFLASLRHPNILGFLGIVIDPPCLVMEYAHRGSLSQVLQQAAASPEAAGALSWSLRLRILLDAAKGMSYLHQRHCIHRDLKSPNLLIDKHWHCKVADFNLSKMLIEAEGSAAQKKSSQAVNNPRWLAPEILEGRPSNAGSDVFSFGVIMWECAVLHLPWDDQTTWQIVNAVTRGQRPALPQDLSQLPGGGFAALGAYLGLLQQCWAQDPAQRPDFEHIATQLRRLLVDCGTASRPRREPSLASVPSE